MEQTKRQRNNSIDHDDDSKKRKFQSNTNGSSSKSFTRFEDMSNEIIYEIFEFLDFFHRYDAFLNLNRRFENLLIYSPLPIHINLSLMSKSTFQYYYKLILLSDKHRIKSLRLSIPFAFDSILSSSNIQLKFVQLETLILDNIDSKSLENLLNHLTSLSSLSSLSIICMDKIDHLNHLYLQLFRLPVLKYCKLSFSKNYQLESIPMATNQYSSIEYLIIECNVQINVLYHFLSYVPQLRRLSCQSLVGYDNISTDINISLKNVIHVSLGLYHISFDQLEFLIKQFCYKIQVLHISGDASQEHLDAQRWKQLILNHLPYLRIFDIQFVYSIVFINDQQTYDHLFNQFSSQFWFERQWFFDYRRASIYGNRTGVFYSINPYRGKDYRLVGKMNENTCSTHQETNLNSVRHVYIYGEKIINDCINYFSNATHVTFYDNFCLRTRSFTSTLNHIVSLQQLTKIDIDTNRFSFQKFCELLQFAPNVDTLMIKSEILKGAYSELMRQSEIFRLVSNRNIIKHITIKDKYTLKKIEILLSLCPRLQSLTSDAHVFWHDFEPIIRYLLSKTSENVRHLSVLCVSNACPALFERLKSLIESEKLIDDYSTKHVNSKLYLWF
ncbi:unnamed protein product [Rotaria sp. Silwood2]|nr:unnamed protein product [Rotaria sp. Silwood2]CAF2891044.1 unnamed protein product [Rotaria sp. Silwood2]CAF3245884.1 unnamed protein product [Rotaria sp. Silwood2]CAF3976970.1 unnamed protein product [Rotaria sp. Silwood2]CAF4000472.1 unnamed protein product [Rotaria sp. Silwood2]